METSPVADDAALTLQDDANQPHIDSCWLLVLESWIGAPEHAVAVECHRRFYVMRGSR